MDDLENKGNEEIVDVPEEPEKPEVVEEPIHKEQEPLRDEFVTRREYISHRPNKGSWVFAIILIFLGFVFLFHEMGLPLLENWGALFIMIPAIGSFGSAWNAYHDHGNQFSSQVMGSLIGGIIFTFITTIFLFNLNWSYMWPILLIVVGLMIFINSFFKK